MNINGKGRCLSLRYLELILNIINMLIYRRVNTSIKSIFYKYNITQKEKYCPNCELTNCLTTVFNLILIL